MKKVYIIICVLFLFSVTALLLDKAFNGDKKGINYPSNQKKHSESSKFFSDEMQEKYPEIEEIFTKNIRKIDSVFEINRNEDWLAGVYDKETGKLLIPHKYKELTQCDMSYCMFFNAKDDKSNKILDYKNNVVFESNYDELECNWCGIYTKNNGKYGLVSYMGKEILKPKYDKIECQKNSGESGQFFYTVQKGNLYGVFDNKGRTVIPFQKEKMERGHGNFFIIKKANKKGAKDIYGNIIIKPEYGYVEYRDDFFVLCDFNDKCGTADITGRQELPFKFKQNIRKVFDDVYSASEKPGDEYLVDKHGQKLNDKKFHSIVRINKEYATFRIYDYDIEKSTYGVINKHGKIIMEAMPDLYVEKVSRNGIIKVLKDGKQGVVYNNKLVLEPMYKIFFFRGHVLVLSEEDGVKYYYVASYEDFAKHNGNLNKFKKYFTSQYKKLDNGCFRFLNNDGTEDMYCDSK